MMNLKMVFSVFAKAAISGLLVFGYIWVLVWGLEEFFGYKDYPRIQDVFKHIFLFTSVTAAGLFVVSKLLGFVRLKFLGGVAGKVFNWFSIGSLVFIGVFTSMVFYQEVRDSVSIFKMVVVVASIVFGSYVAYILAGNVLGFFGWQFEMLGNALPKGRSVLFSEALNAGYDKPQNRAFISELSNVDGGAGYVYTSFILYGIPACTLFGMIVSMLFLGK